MGIVDLIWHLIEEILFRGLFGKHWWAWWLGLIGFVGLFLLILHLVDV